MISFFKRVFLYMKKYWKWILGGIAFIAAVSGLIFVKDEVISMCIYNRKLDLMKKKKEIDLLEVKKAIIKTRIDFTEEQIAEVDSKIAEIKADMDKDRKEISKLTLKQKLDRFNDLGY